MTVLTKGRNSSLWGIIYGVSKTKQMGNYIYLLQDISQIANFGPII